MLQMGTAYSLVKTSHILYWDCMKQSIAWLLLNLLTGSVKEVVYSNPNDKDRMALLVFMQHYKFNVCTWMWLCYWATNFSTSVGCHFTFCVNMWYPIILFFFRCCMPGRRFYRFSGSELVVYSVVRLEIRAYLWFKMKQALYRSKAL